MADRAKKRKQSRKESKKSLQSDLDVVQEALQHVYREFSELDFPTFGNLQELEEIRDEFDRFNANARALPEAREVAHVCVSPEIVNIVTRRLPAPDAKVLPTSRGGVGVDNELTDIGKIILRNLMVKKFKTFAGSSSLDFYEERAKCMESHKLYEDPTFPANEYALYHSERKRENAKKRKNIEWKRPADITSKPQFLVDYANRHFDVSNGESSSAWFVSALSSLITRDELWYRVIPPDQGFGSNYAGIFHFQFWKETGWVDVIIDDRLPFDTSTQTLLFAHSESGQEFWSALVEKAYAKLHGCYERIDRGRTMDALEDLTGGLSEVVSVPGHEDEDRQHFLNLLTQFMRGFKTESIYAAGVTMNDVDEPSMAQSTRPKNAYCITALRVVPLLAKVGDPKTEYLCLLRLRDPYGKRTWKMPQDQWGTIEPSFTKRLEQEFQYDKDGFWMPVREFVRIFDHLEVTHLPKSNKEDVTHLLGYDEWMEGTHRWSQLLEPQGSWAKEEGTAGGPPDQKSFWHNPQYRMRFIEYADTAKTVIVTLLHKNRTTDKESGRPALRIYQVASGTEHRLNKETAQGHESYDGKNIHKHGQVRIEQQLLPDYDYIIIPYNSKKGVRGDFALRIFSIGEAELKLLDPAEKEKSCVMM